MSQPIPLNDLDQEQAERLAAQIGAERLDFIERWGRVCGSCQGSGLYLYSSTATWRGGAGGQAFTPGVCDQCWGSGCADLPWPSHRLMRNSK